MAQPEVKLFPGSSSNAPKHGNISQGAQAQRQICPVLARSNRLCSVLENQDRELPKAHQEVDGFLPALIMWLVCSDVIEGLSLQKYFLCLVAWAAFQFLKV